MQIAEYIVCDTEEWWCPWNVLGATHKGKHHQQNMPQKTWMKV